MEPTNLLLVMLALHKDEQFAIRAGATAVLCLLLCPHTSHAQSAVRDPQILALKKLSLEELSDIAVTTVSRREQPATEAAAAVHVIIEEGVRRSGARSIPEALRLAPNLQVAQSGSRSWAISARGFNASFANKLLVLIDGPAVYSPLFAGVFWDAQDTLLEDIDRIEVISGPGARINALEHPARSPSLPVRNEKRTACTCLRTYR